MTEEGDKPLESGTEATLTPADSPPSPPAPPAPRPEAMKTMAFGEDRPGNKLRRLEISGPMATGGDEPAP